MTLTFGNQSLFFHIARGLLGFGALYLALTQYDVIGWPVWLLFGVTVWMLKGCPICWTIGLFETAAYKVFLRNE
jgi:hypothetical protein